MLNEMYYIKSYYYKKNKTFKVKVSNNLIYEDALEDFNRIKKYMRNDYYLIQHNYDGFVIKITKGNKLIKKYKYKAPQVCIKFAFVYSNFDNINRDMRYIIWKEEDLYNPSYKIIEERSMFNVNTIDCVSEEIKKHLLSENKLRKNLDVKLISMVFFKYPNGKRVFVEESVVVIKEILQHSN